MKQITTIFLLMLCLFVMNAQAASLFQTERDCTEILEQWAEDPDSVPQHLVDECQAAMAGTAPAAVGDDIPNLNPGAGDNALAAAADPCAGPGAASSVLCWGPWSTLSPAAAPDAGPPDVLPVDDYQQRPELAARFDPILTGTCDPGAPCGFATIVDGVTSQGPAADTRISRFTMNADGSSFTVDPGQPGEIASVGGMGTAYTNRADGFENLRSTGTVGTQASRLIARVRRDANGNIVDAADVWSNGDRTTRDANSGFFAWGNAMAQADLDVLNGQGIVANYTGPMSVDNATVASITVNFGSQATWTGDWTNPAYAFDAGGAIIGVDLVSDAGQFSNNVGANSSVQGALTGSRDAKALVHAIDVDIAGVGRIKDVGLLIE